MRIIAATDEEFSPYGRILDLDSSEFVAYLKEKAKMPQEGNLYVRSDEAMLSLKGAKQIQEEAFGMGDIEIGYCNGYNSLLNCLESHACPEVDVAADDLVLLLALPTDVHDGKIDSKDVKAFLLKKGQAALLYPYTFHFSPCKLSEEGFRCAIVLSEGTNADLKEKPSDPRIWKVNKWLFAHPESGQAKLGAYLGIEGENLKVELP